MSVPVYLVGLALTKLSILFLYLRFFVGSTVRRVTYALIAFVIAFSKH